VHGPVCHVVMSVGEFLVVIVTYSKTAGDLVAF